MKRAFALLALFAVSSPISAQRGGPEPFMVAETGRGFFELKQAIDSIGEKSGTILIAPGSYKQCAAQYGGRITYKARVAGSVIFDGMTCEGKAALILNGDWHRVEGIIFQNMSVADQNGAGIRLASGDLEVFNSTFRNSEQGILTNPNPRGSIKIDYSTFSGLGICADDCAHSIYIGDYGSLSVTNSRFERGNGGHYVKARAANVYIANNSFDDTRGRATNYMIDLPAGSVGQIVNNEFVQGPNKENYGALIAVGAEQLQHPSRGLVIANNRARVAPGFNHKTVFVANWTNDQLRMGGNVLGAGIAPYEKRSK
ncbi:MAG: hypothetical protein RIS52_364 [Pseudomonadota bacterium]|jgi:hypothetical protein